MNEKKNKKITELISYGFWGVMTVLFSYVSYWLLKFVFADFKVANLISIVATKVFAYIVNKKFVFKTKSSFIDTLKEIVRFIFARGFTGVVDWVGQILLVEVAMIDDMVAKVLMIGITTILNYSLSAIGVFKKEDKITENEKDCE